MRTETKFNRILCEVEAETAFESEAVSAGDGMGFVSISAGANRGAEAGVDLGLSPELYAALRSACVEAIGIRSNGCEGRVVSVISSLARFDNNATAASAV